MKLRVLYFAALRERIGRVEESLDAPNDVANVAQLRAGWRSAVNPGARHLPKCGACGPRSIKRWSMSGMRCTTAPKLHFFLR